MAVDRGMRRSFSFCQSTLIGSGLLQAHVRWLWPVAVFILVLLGGVGRTNRADVMAQASPPSAPTTRDEKKLLITQEDRRTFQLLRQGLPAVRVTFLTSRTVRIHSIGNEPVVNLP